MTYLSKIEGLWRHKLSDRFHSGLPDIIGCYKGRMFAIELKDKGKKPRTIQRITMDIMSDAGVIVDWFDEFDDVKQFIDEVVVCDRTK